MIKYAKSDHPFDKPTDSRPKGEKHSVQRALCWRSHSQEEHFYLQIPFRTVEGATFVKHQDDSSWFTVFQPNVTGSIPFRLPLGFPLLLET